VVTRKTAFPLPRSVYVLQAGLVLNAFGNGAANPFVLVYLHDVRGIPLAAAGLAAATSAGCALAASLLSGSAADRFGARATMTAGLALSATGFLLYPAVTAGWQAVLVATLTGGGIGTWLTGQSALLAVVTPAELRPLAFAQQRVAANVGLGLGGFVGGLIAAGPGFTSLFLLNAVTFVAYALVVRTIPDARPAPRAATGDYREVLRDGAFLRVAAITFVFVAAAVSLLNALVPVFAVDQVGVGTETVGALFLLNSLVIVALQIPIARLQAGRRRMVAFAQMGALFAASWLLVLAAGVVDARSVELLVAAILVFSLAECLYDSVQGPLTADLAGARLTGRYMAVSGFSWQLGFVVGPAAGAALMSVEPLALWPVAALLCVAAGIASLRVEHRLPQEVRRTPERPRPGRPAASVGEPAAGVDPLPQRPLPPAAERGGEQKRGHTGAQNPGA
jgi:MFS family permease